MYLTLTNIGRSLFTNGFREAPQAKSLEDEDHTPRDGKDITPAQVERALMTALHMDRLAARSLSSALPPLLRKDGTFDLIDTRRHNVIEHDSSFTRLDFHQGDNYTFQPSMLQAMIDDADGGDVTLRSLAKTFIRRNKESRAAGAPRLPLHLWFVRLLQAVGVMNAAQTGGVLTRELLEAVFAEERFPDVVLDNPKPRTMFTLLGYALGMLRYVVLGP
ncbi:MAG: hypothetical protein Q9168_005266 [Polycauliona sp. 1 TL-2023]